MMVLKLLNIKYILLGFLLIPLFSYAKNVTYHLDTTKSKLHWGCAKHFGTIDYSFGQLSFVDKEIVSGKFDANMSSIKDLDIEYELMQKTLENILKSAEFFDVESYPFSSLNIDLLKRSSDSTYQIQADLHVLGGDVCVEFIATLTTLEDQSLHIITSKFTVDRTKWGLLLYSPSYPDGNTNPDRFEVPDEVVLWGDLYFFPVEK